MATLGPPLTIVQPNVPTPYNGILQVTDYLTDGAAAVLYVAPQAAPDIDRAEFDRLYQWAESRLQRLGEHGPEPDGWARRRAGTFEVLELLARTMYLPDPIND